MECNDESKEIDIKNRVTILMTELKLKILNLIKFYCKNIRKNFQFLTFYTNLWSMQKSLGIRFNKLDGFI